MATATLLHGYDPALVSQHLGAPALFITRADDYLFDVDCDQAALDAAVAAVIAGDPVAAPVPDEVDSLSFELVLHDMGAHSAVMAYVATLSEGDQIYWRRRKTMRRDSSLIEAGRVALGWSQAQVDELFRLAGLVVT